jgi:signal transduction histidine kinase
MFEDYNELQLNLLIVDDEPEIVKALSRQFRRKYNVYSTTNPMEGISIMEKENIQVVLSDQRMPGMTGIDFFSRIKTKYPEALRLILTGYSDIEAVIGAINEGQVFRYVTKPWNPEELETIIREAFEKYELITKNRRLVHSLQIANETLELKVKERTIELEKANQKLSDLNIEKNRYLGMVAHDLRNPIGVAESFSSLIIDEMGALSDNQLKEYVEIINNRCNYSLDLIHNFLDISKIEAGIFDLNLSEHEYVSFVKANILQEEILAGNKSQVISVRSSVDRVNLRFDGNKIQQVLNNLLSNAIKYSMPNTSILVEISMDNDFVKTAVVDQGQGIPANELSSIFDAYQTTSVKATAHEKSTGLGLAIVKKIIEAHKGNISVISEPGKGSVFSFLLPL